MYNNVCFASVWQWVVDNSYPVMFGTELQLFELLFNSYLTDEGKCYDAAWVSSVKSGRASLPRKMVSKYWTVPAFQDDLADAVAEVLVPSIPDLAGAVAKLVDIIQSDNTLSSDQKHKLLQGCVADGGEDTAVWIAYMIRYSMLRRGVTLPKAA